jgi:hypothetical protein
MTGLLVDVPSPSQMRFSTIADGSRRAFYRFHTPAGAFLGHLSVVAPGPSMEDSVLTGSIAIGGMRNNPNASLRSRKEILAFAMKRVRERGGKFVWESNAYDEYYQDLWDFQYKKPLFKDVVYEGYIMEIPPDIDALLLK